jgi:hypothetical protein
VNQISAGWPNTFTDPRPAAAERDNYCYSLFPEGAYLAFSFVNDLSLRWQCSCGLRLGMMVTITDGRMHLIGSMIATLDVTACSHRRDLWETSPRREGISRLCIYSTSRCTNHRLVLTDLVLCQRLGREVLWGNASTSMCFVVLSLYEHATRSLQPRRRSSTRALSCGIACTLCPVSYVL